MKVLVALLLENMPNILTFSDFYKNMLFISKHIILCENETYLRVHIVTVCVSLFLFILKGKIKF